MGPGNRRESRSRPEEGNIVKSVEVRKGEFRPRNELIPANSQLSVSQSARRNVSPSLAMGEVDFHRRRPRNRRKRSRARKAWKPALVQSREKRGRKEGTRRRVGRGVH